MYIDIFIYIYIYIDRERVPHMYAHADSSADHSSVEAVLEVFPELEAGWFG